MNGQDNKRAHQSDTQKTKKARTTTKNQSIKTNQPMKHEAQANQPVNGRDNDEPTSTYE